MSIVDVSKRLGHSKVSVTLDTYSHMMPGQDRAIADKLGNLFAREKSLDDALLEKSRENRVHDESTGKVIRVQFGKIDPSNEEPIRNNVVVGARLELATRGFSVRCSTN